MQLSASEIAGYINGKIEGDEAVKVNHPAKIEDGKSGSICFLANKKYVDHIYQTEASIVLIDESIELNKPVKPTLIWVSNAYAAFTSLLEQYQKANKQTVNEIDLAVVSPSAEIGEGTTIGANAYVGANVKIGKNCIIYPNVTIHHSCEVGDNCIIHSGTVIGADGFGFAPQADGTYKKIPQVGNVVIGNGVEIGSNCCIDRATMGSTKIKDGVKLDNLIQIAHNVVLEENTVIAAQTGIAGSTNIGANCMIGGQVGIVGHIKIAPGTKIQAQSGIAKTIEEPNKAWNDSPAFGYRAALKSQAIYKNLPDLLSRIEELENQLKNNSTENA